MSKSKQYWLDRMLDRDKAAKLSEDKLLEELNKYYTDSYIAIEKELNNFYVKYATENGLSYNQARKILAPKDIREYSSKIGELKKLYAETKDINVYLKMQEIGSRANVTRLQSLLDSIDIELIKSAHNTQISIEQHLSNMYKRSYKQALEDIGVSNKAINNRAVKEALSYPWSGKNFSERIWGNKASTMNVLKEAISKGIIQGQSIQKMAKSIMDKEKVSRYNAERLVRTETNFHMTKGHIDGYRESGVVKAVEICVHWDERTCPDCESMDREVIPLNEVSYGSNVPPFHPFCRCTVVPVISDKFNIDDERIIRSYDEYNNNDKQDVVISNVNWYNYISVDNEDSKNLNKIHTSLNEFMKTEKREKVVLYDKFNKGNIAEIEGTSSNEVILSNKNIKDLKSAKDDSIILIHNHPSTTTFSRYDIQKIVTNKSIGAMTLECIDGTKYILEKENKISIFGRMNYLSNYEKIYNSIAKKYPELENEKTIYNVWEDFINDVTTEVAKYYKIKYKKVKNSE